MSSAKRLIFVSTFNRSSSSLPEEAPSGARPCGRTLWHSSRWRLDVTSDCTVTRTPQLV